MPTAKLIEDLEVIEVSEVDNPAIGETFYIVKGDGEMADIFSDAYYEEIEKKLGKKVAETIKSALQVLMPVFKNAPEDVKSAIVTLAEAVGYGYPEPEKYPEPVEKKWESKLNTVERVIGKIAEQIDKLVEEFEKLKEDLQPLKKSDESKDEQVDLEAINKALDELMTIVENKIKEEEAIRSGLEELLRGEK